MPWYPGSEGFVTRFWDARQWQIGLTSDYLVIEGKWIALNDIAGVSYWHRTTLHFPTATMLDKGPSYVYRGFTVTDFRGYTATLEFNNKLLRDVPENEIAWRGLVDISRRTIEPRISQRIFASIRAGAEYSVKDGRCFVTLSPSGFTGRTFRTTTYPWSDFYHVEVNPFQGVNVSTNHGQARIWAQSGEKRKTRLVTGLDTRVPNAVVLASLMPMCAAAFATRIY
ncbi:hypothetical protein BST20_27835 [Mycobacterium branderi]|uniref:Uncharacterized protein n=2 Tax=Mycobacterium branderi TaxID=43348 RepID=A0A7I7WDN0_9MYCO|nr:hypothetical protein BST20_27835 [Mycobacterium branderi]BBZ15042.1 hypothetical protein MBRA_52370 [Mycobacterium branderi]